MIEQTKRIAFLLGAGFSVPAGMPTANELNNRVLSEIEYRIKRPFTKYGQNECYKKNEYNVFEFEKDCLRAFILDKLLNDYCHRYKKFNYEQFYDFIFREKGFIVEEWDFEVRKYKDKLIHNRLLSFINRGLYNYYGKYYQNDLQNIDYYNVIQNLIDNWYQLIIAESFLKNTNKGKLTQFLPEYEGFKEILKHYAKQNYIIDIYTLNHDLVLESLLSHTEMKDEVCDSFGGEDKKFGKWYYKTFDYKKHFDKPIRIYKLHGSIDLYKLFPQCEYIQIIDGYDKDIIYDSHEGQNTGILPLFLTGKKSKIEMYNYEPFRTLLYEFHKNIGYAEKLIVIGYSGYDDGINKGLEQYNFKSARVVNPNAEEHYYVKRYGAKAIEKGIESLTLKDIEN